MLPLALIVVTLVFLVAGLLAHFVADQRGRPPWEPWILTSVALLLTLGCTLLSMPVVPFAAALAPLPVLLMFVFPRRRVPCSVPTGVCPHCGGQYQVDVRFAGHPVTCPHCQRAFLGPRGR